MHRALSRLTDSVSHNGCNGQNRLLIKLHPFALASINLLSLFAAVRIIFNDFFKRSSTISVYAVDSTATSFRSKLLLCADNALNGQHSSEMIIRRWNFIAAVSKNQTHELVRC